MPADFPFGFDGTGRTSVVAGDAHLDDLIRLVLFTAPGERLMRPDFGCGIGNLLFTPLSDTLAATTRHLVEGALIRFLGDRLSVDAVETEVGDGVLTVTIAYRRRDTGEAVTTAFRERVSA
jgi:hypothetical protein